MIVPVHHTCHLGLKIGSLTDYDSKVQPTNQAVCLLRRVFEREITIRESIWTFKRKLEENMYQDYIGLYLTIDTHNEGGIDPDM